MHFLKRVIATALRTGVVVLGAVAQAFLLLQHKLGQHQIVRHLHCSHVQPLENQIVHGVANWRERRGELIQEIRQSGVSQYLGRKTQLTAFQLHRTRLAVHWEILQIHRAGQSQCQPKDKTASFLFLFIYLFFRKEKKV